MLKRYTVKNPYEEFEVGEYYSKSQIDNIYDDISDTITQTDLDNRIVDFISGDEVHVRASAYTEDFQSESVINTIVSDFVVNYIRSDEIDSRIAASTADFLNEHQLNTKMNNFLVEYVTNTNVSLMIDSAITYWQEDYWHPVPIYERYIWVGNRTNNIASPDRSTVQFIISGNTAWSILDDSPAWLELDTYVGFGITLVTATAQSANNSETARTHVYDLRANDIYGTPLLITIRQAAAS